MANREDREQEGPPGVEQQWLRGPSGARVGGEDTARGEEQCESADPAPPPVLKTEKVRDDRQITLQTDARTLVGGIGIGTI